MPKFSWESMKVSLQKISPYRTVIWLYASSLGVQRKPNSCYYSLNLLQKNHVEYEIRKNKHQVISPSPQQYSSTLLVSVD